MIGQIKKLGNPILRETAPVVEEINDSIISLTKRMQFFLNQCEGYGLAANQIGYNKRIFQYMDGSKVRTVINPTLFEHDDEMWLFNEGCLSIPGFYFPIWRPRTVLLGGIDLDGNTIRIEAKDILARVFQHEMDHMNGKLVIDILNTEERADFANKWKKPRGKKKKR